jgi:hypothetical protein
MSHDLTPAVPADGNRPEPGRRFRWWLWFAAGFLLVFVGLSLVLSMHYFDGHAVYRTRLWHYYLLEVRRAWHSTGNLGPASGTSSAVTVLAQHLLFSAIGGAILTGAAWAVRALSRRRGRAER